MSIPQERRPILVVLEQPSPYQAMVVQGLRSVAEPLGIPLFMVMADPFAAGTGPALARALARLEPMGAVLFAMPTERDDLAIAQSLAGVPSLPVVRMGTADGAGVTVGADNALGMRDAVRHLVTGCGVRTPLMVRGVPHQVDSMVREAAVRAELAEHGLAMDPELVVDGLFQRDDSYREVNRVLRTRRDVDAVIAFNDRSALGAMDAVHQAGLRIPQDVVVTGFDDEDVAGFSRPPLSSVNQRLHEQGAVAARLLLAQRNGEPVGDVLVPTRFVPRASTDRTGQAADPAGPGSAPTDDHCGTGTDPGTLWTQMAALDTALALTRAFMQCRTLDEAVAALNGVLPRLSVTRAFLVLIEPGRRSVGRVVLVHRQGRVDELPGRAPFPVDQLLPEHLHDEFLAGTLGLQPLSTERGELGYLLLEQQEADRFVSEAVRMDLSRTLDTIARNAELALRAEDLEHEVAARTRELEAEIATRRAAEQELQELNEQLRLQLHLDGLTGICNRTGFDEVLVAQWSEHSRSGGPLSLLMIDVDYFKRYNDTFGHLAGDECLRKVAACMKHAVHRPLDLVARYGGEEFAMILPNTPLDGAVEVAQRLQAELAETAIPHPASTHQVVTVSVGAATRHPGRKPESAQLIAAADLALYVAKDGGRDRISTNPAR